MNNYFRIIFLILIQCLIGYSSWSQSTEMSKGRLTINNKRIILSLDSLKKSSIDSISFSFKFKNTGKKIFSINQVKPSCSCTLSDFTKGKILPGKSGTILLGTTKAAFLQVKRIEALIKSDAENDYESISIILK